MLLINLSNPEQAPEEGNWVRYIYEGTAEAPTRYVDKQFHAPVETPAVTHRTRVTKDEYRDLFTFTEQVKIDKLTANVNDLAYTVTGTISLDDQAAGYPVGLTYRDLARTLVAVHRDATELNMENPRMVAAIDLFAGLGLLDDAQTRPAEILLGVPL